MGQEVTFPRCWSLFCVSGVVNKKTLETNALDLLDVGIAHIASRSFCHRKAMVQGSFEFGDGMHFMPSQIARRLFVEGWKPQLA